jgi:hypothetical protein
MRFCKISKFDGHVRLGPAAVARRKVVLLHDPPPRRITVDHPRRRARSWRDAGLADGSRRPGLRSESCAPPPRPGRAVPTHASPTTCRDGCSAKRRRWPACALSCSRMADPPHKRLSCAVGLHPLVGFCFILMWLALFLECCSAVLGRCRAFLNFPVRAI